MTSATRKLRSDDIIIRTVDRLPVYYKGRTARGSTELKLRPITSGIGPPTLTGNLADFTYPDGTPISG
jgi:hypothetical protein